MPIFKKRKGREKCFLQNIFVCVSLIYIVLPFSADCINFLKFRFKFMKSPAKRVSLPFVGFQPIICRRLSVFSLFCAGGVSECSACKARNYVGWQVFCQLCFLFFFILLTRKKRGSTSSSRRCLLLKLKWRNAAVGAEPIAVICGMPFVLCLPPSKEKIESESIFATPSGVVFSL